MDRLANDIVMSDVVVVLVIHLPFVVVKSERYCRMFAVEKIMIRKHDNLDDDNDMLWLASVFVAVSGDCSWRASFDPTFSPSSSIVAQHETCVRLQSSVLSFLYPFLHSTSPACRGFDRVVVVAPVFFWENKYYVDETFIDYSTHFDPDHHVEMTLRVLFNDIPHIVRFSRLLKLSPGHEILNFSYRTNGIPMSFSQPVKGKLNELRRLFMLIITLNRRPLTG